jgi:pyruvate dehydrogenase E2 component (dihydrolipoamide acetyltransferase)
MELVRFMPAFLLKPLTRLFGYLSGVLGVKASFLSLEPYPFGSCIITSVGMFDLDEAYIPPTPFAHVPFYVAIPTIRETPVVEDGKIVIRPMLNLTATLDHRFMDGYQGGELAKEIRRLFASPELMAGQDILAAPYLEIKNLDPSPTQVAVNA